MWKFWKRKPCVMCQRYAIRMTNIRQSLSKMDRITRGRTTLTGEDLMNVLTGLGLIHIEASKKEE
jgi:hypothetical protein